jgi:hypothetical protein
MIARGVDIEDVKRVLENPKEVIFDLHEGTFKCYDPAKDTYTNQDRFLVVVYVNFNNTTKVLS